MEVTPGNRYAGFVPDLTPIVVSEKTDFGWRGLTEDGEILNVNGGAGPTGNLTMVDVGGRPIGFRTVAELTDKGTIDSYLTHFYCSGQEFRQTRFAPALVEIERALGFAPTTRAQFNRAMILLSMGRWAEGFHAYARCETHPAFMRPICRVIEQLGPKPWRGEPLAGKHLLLVHAHGFGDSIMMLRFVRRLEAMGARISIMVPPPLATLARQLAPVVEEPPADTDCYIALLQLMGPLRMTPNRIPLAPYLTVDAARAGAWRTRLGEKTRPRIGLAWSVGKFIESDYPRPAPLQLIVDELAIEGAELISVQQQDHEAAEKLGIKTFKFDDFADCAALMSVLDEIVTVDTAAAHLAGAIGHGRISVLLSHWHSWRWLSPCYENVTLCRQDKPGDWKSALAARWAR